MFFMVSTMFTVIFDYYEYSDAGEFLGENTDYAEFKTEHEAQDYLSSLSDDSNVRKAWLA